MSYSQLSASQSRREPPRGSVLRTILGVVRAAAVAHPRDRVMGPVAVGAVRFPGLVVVVSGGDARCARTRRGGRPAAAPLCGVRASTTCAAGAVVRREARRLLGLPGRAGPARTFGDGLDDFGVRRAGVPRPRRCGALGGSAGAGGVGRGGLGRTAGPLDGVLAAWGSAASASSSAGSRVNSDDIFDVRLVLVDSVAVDRGAPHVASTCRNTSAPSRSAARPPT